MTAVKASSFGCILVIAFAALTFLGPFLACFLLPLSHTYVRTPHPQSPHTPPVSLVVNQEQIESFKRDGFLVIRKSLSDTIINLLRKGSEDLRTNRTLHCDMSYYNSPPIFHRYSHFCMWPDKVHDLFRDALYHSSLAAVASQLMGNKPIRVFSTFTMGSTKEMTIPKRWHADFPVFTGTDSCSNGLVMWLPLEETSFPDANGMILAQGSGKEHYKAITNGSWKSFQLGVSGQLELLKFYNTLGENSPSYAPILEVGDVLVFSKCTVHTSSGVNTRRLKRHAWQIRFFTDSQLFVRGLNKAYPGMGTKFTNLSDPHIRGPKYPLLAPATLQQEDVVRNEGHMTLTRLEWAQLMLSHPRHLFVTSIVRYADTLGLFAPQHPLYSSLVKIGELCILLQS